MQPGVGVWECEDLSTIDVPPAQYQSMFHLVFGDVGIGDTNPLNSWRYASIYGFPNIFCVRTTPTAKK